jgi:hypothetical protein
MQKFGDTSLLHDMQIISQSELIFCFVLFCLHDFGDHFQLLMNRRG